MALLLAPPPGEPSPAAREVMTSIDALVQRAGEDPLRALRDARHIANRGDWAIGQIIALAHSGHPPRHSWAEIAAAGALSQGAAVNRSLEARGQPRRSRSRAEVPRRGRSPRKRRGKPRPEGGDST